MKAYKWSEGKPGAAGECERLHVTFSVLQK